MIRLRRTTHAPPLRARAGDRPLYAFGDVHGRYDLLHVLLAEIARDAAERDAAAKPLLVFCGDYVDRGPDSAKVLAALAWLKRSPVLEVRLLEGNHESILRTFLTEPEECAQWLSFGGRETLRSYGVDAPDAITPGETLPRLRDALLDAMPVSHHRLLDTLELSTRVGDYLFVHAGVRPGVPMHRQKREDLLWIREPFLDHPSPAAQPIVHGHTWVDDQPTILPHRLGIDTGAYATGVLTALRIADDAVETIQAVAEG